MITLPKIPRFPKRLCSSELDGSISVPCKDLALREGHDILSLIELRGHGEALVVLPDSPVARYHGCRNCPWYGSSFCFLKIVPPSVYEGGICNGRLNEVLDIAEIAGSSDGLQIRKREVAERIRNHILILEANLADYAVKRAAFKRNIQDCPLDEGESLAQRNFELSQFDSYQQNLQRQIELLSVKFAEFLQLESKLEDGKGRIHITLSPLDVGRMIRLSKITDSAESGESKIMDGGDGDG